MFANLSTEVWPVANINIFIVPPTDYIARLFCSIVKHDSSSENTEYHKRAGVTHAKTTKTCDKNMPRNVVSNQSEDDDLSNPTYNFIIIFLLPVVDLTSYLV